MDAKTLLGYALLYRVQIYLFTVVDREAAAFVQEHRFQSFVRDWPLSWVDELQEMEHLLNHRCPAIYVRATSQHEWNKLVKEADLRLTLQEKYIGKRESFAQMWREGE